MMGPVRRAVLRRLRCAAMTISRAENADAALDAGRAPRDGRYPSGSVHGRGHRYADGLVAALADMDEPDGRGRLAASFLSAPGQGAEAAPAP